MNANLHLLDGTDANDFTNNGPGSAAGLSLGVEAIREFRVLTHNFSAEYGRNAGAIISAITRSGTNQFHGSAFEFVRNNIFDARNFFKIAQAPAPSPLPAYRQNQFGASFGGPLRKDRIFFFLNYEGYRQRQGVTSITSVPDLNTRQGLLPNPTTGVLTPVGPGPNNGLNPAVVPYLNLYFLPNGRNLGGGVAEFIANSSNSATDDYALERMDFRLSDKDSFYWRYVFDPSNAVIPPAGIPFGITTATTNHFAVLSETHVFSGALLNESRFAFNRTFFDYRSTGVDINHALDFVPGAGFGQISFTATSTVGGTGAISQTGTNTFNPQYFPQNIFQVTDTLSYVTGPHTWKFGFNIERLQNGAYVYALARGQYIFSSLPSFLLGNPTTATFALLEGTGSNVRGFRQTLLGWFIQDDLRVRPNLTLNLGLRHEFVTSPYEVNSKSASLINMTDSERTVGPSFKSTKLNFAPRVGLAWDPTGKGKTSIRPGAGVFYNQLLAREWQNTSKDDYRFTRTYLVRNPPNFPNMLLSGYTPGIAAERTMQYRADTPTLIHYNLEIQQQLSPTISIHGGFVGSYGYNLTYGAEENIRVAQILADGSKFFSLSAPFVNPNFSSILRELTGAHSNYNALQAGVDKRLSGGLLLQANYSYAKNLSDADSVDKSILPTTVPNVLDRTDLGRDYGRSAYDQRHSFSLSGRYQLPLDNLLKSRLAKTTIGGWEVNGTFIAGSGFPLNILAGFNNSQNGDTINPDRPNLNPGFSNNPTSGTTAGCQGVPAGQKLGTPTLWFDPCAFSLSPAGTFGNLAKNTVGGPTSFSADFTMAKNFPVREKMNLQFRAEFFNILNHANFRAPSSTNVFTAARVRSGTVGRITGAFPGRQIQFGLKLTF